MSLKTYAALPDEEANNVRIEKGVSAHIEEVRKWTSSRFLHFTFLYTVIICLSGMLLSNVLRNGSPMCGDISQQLFSPASSAISYEITTFGENFYQKTPYMCNVTDGLPTNATDKKWIDLYDFGNSWVTKDDARQLTLDTVQLPNSDLYVTQLTVFHDLHCLNVLRKSLYPDRYMSDYDDFINKDGSRNYTSVDAQHYDHCIDNLRRSIMCHGDVSTISWSYNKYRRVPLPDLRLTKTCRNYDKLREWGHEHEVMTALKWKHGPESAFKHSWDD
ncbi:hypothetical protein BT63DRAFT_464245 [Microthyrium microscopicum]|uniref:Tat pathway signal sequence n=1 Tax=Microthyrium microscopicum TaxID=703497 RepID=A0A6A6U211_9PEZI|nr:hypothetical protein BT63DRAFT_464245 [Microthyrium microscopicum]